MHKLSYYVEITLDSIPRYLFDASKYFAFKNIDGIRCVITFFDNYYTIESQTRNFSKIVYGNFLDLSGTVLDGILDSLNFVHVHDILAYCGAPVTHLRFAYRLQLLNSSIITKLKSEDNIRVVDEIIHIPIPDEDLSSLFPCGLVFKHKNLPYITEKASWIRCRRELIISSFISRICSSYAEMSVIDEKYGTISHIAHIYRFPYPYNIPDMGNNPDKYFGSVFDISIKDRDVTGFYNSATVIKAREDKHFSSCVFDPNTSRI